LVDSFVQVLVKSVFEVLLVDIFLLVIEFV
jgi:hypothetical protein